MTSGAGSPIFRERQSRGGVTRVLRARTEETEEDDVMKRTSREDERMAAMMRRMGCGREEIAATLGVSKRTVDRIARRYEESKRKTDRPDMNGSTMTEHSILAFMGAMFAQAQADVECCRALAEKEPDNPRWTNL